MKFGALLALVFLGGCSTTVPVARPFPEVPTALQKRCEDLKQVESGKNSITDVLKVVVENYTLYHECGIRVEGWNDWYAKQREIWEKVDKK